MSFPDQGQITSQCLMDSDSNYARIALSLQSPLPNDQDFAISVCTLLSNDCKKVLKLAKAPYLLNLILGHAGIYNDCALRCLYEESYNGRDLLNHKYFWDDNISSAEIRNLLCESFIPKHRLSLIVQNVNDVKTGERKRRKWSFCTEEEARILNKLAILKSCCPLCPCQKFLNSSPKENSSYPHLKNQPLVPEEQISQRILQIAIVLRNLSFEDDNSLVMASNESMIRFILLGANCSWGQIPQLSYDIMGNVAKYIRLQEPILNPLSSMIIDLVTNGLFSSDRFTILRSLEILSELAKNEDNGWLITQYFEKRIYSRLVELLTIKDVVMLVYTLECILVVSQMTRTACEELVNVVGFVSTLISLLTIDAQSFVPDGCISMRVEEITEIVTTQQKLDSQSQRAPQADPTPATESQAAKESNVALPSTSSPATTFATGASASAVIHITEHLDFPVLSNHLLSADSLVVPGPNTPLAVPVLLTSPPKSSVSTSLCVNASFRTHLSTQVSSGISRPKCRYPVYPNRPNHRYSQPKFRFPIHSHRRPHATGFSKEEIAQLNLSPEQLDIKAPYLCQWNGCGMRFAKPEPVYMHAVRVHCPGSIKGAIECEWGSCDQLPRSRYSLMVHLTDYHCNVSALKLALNYRQKKLVPPKVDDLPSADKHPGYGKYLSFSLMRKRAIENMDFTEFLDEKEGPVTKSIRLTSALILRNLVNFSDKGRKMCRSYESRFATIAMSNVESARTIAQILYDLS